MSPNLFYESSDILISHTIIFCMQGTPQAVEHSLDSKQEVDQQLKISCAEFIDQVSAQLLTKLQDFINKVPLLKSITLIQPLQQLAIPAN